MSMLGYPLGSTMTVDEERMEAAKIQFEAISNVFDVLTNTCREKCIPHRYGESELNKGEAVCTDRCVTKLLKVNAIIGDYLQNEGAGPDKLPSYNALIHAGILKDPSTLHTES